MERRATASRTRTATPSSHTDQNVLYASLMLQLRKEFGGDDFVRRFYRSLHDAPPIRPVDAVTARKQCLSWLVCASVASKSGPDQTLHPRLEALARGGDNWPAGEDRLAENFSHRRVRDYQWRNRLAIRNLSTISTHEIHHDHQRLRRQSSRRTTRAIHLRSWEASPQRG